MAYFYLPLEQQLSIIEQCIAEARSSLLKAPMGYLTVQKCGNSAQFLYRPTTENANRQYIRKSNLSFVQALAQKDYDSSFLRIAQKQKDRLQKLLSKGSVQSASIMYHVLAHPYEKLSPERRSLVTPYILPDDLYIQSFLNTSYEKKGFSEDAPIIMTEKGERVRSKSEKIIADTLNHLGIPYLYEYPLYLQRSGWVSPDFTLLDIRERTIVILEHFGMMQDPSYAAKTLLKRDSYICDGYFPGADLLITCEGGGQVLDIKNLERIIQNRFFS